MTATEESFTGKNGPTLNKEMLVGTFLLGLACYEKKTLFSISQEKLTRRTYYNMMIRNVFLILISGNLLFITVEERVEFDGHLAAEGFPVKQNIIN